MDEQLHRLIEELFQRTSVEHGEGILLFSFKKLLSRWVEGPGSFPLETLRGPDEYIKSSALMYRKLAQNASSP